MKYYSAFDFFSNLIKYKNHSQPADCTKIGSELDWAHRPLTPKVGQCSGYVFNTYLLNE